jgi:hypothetical protein
MKIPNFFFKKAQQTSNIQIQRQLSTLHTGRPKTIDEIKRLEDLYGKEFEMPRSGIGYLKNLAFSIVLIVFIFPLFCFVRIRIIIFLELDLESK